MENPLRKFEPLPEGHPAIEIKCPGCQQKFQVGDVTTLIALGPGDDPEEQKKCREGKAYNAVAVIIHWSCATGET